MTSPWGKRSQADLELHLRQLRLPWLQAFDVVVTMLLVILLGIMLVTMSLPAILIVSMTLLMILLVIMIGFMTLLILVIGSCDFYSYMC